MVGLDLLNLPALSVAQDSLERITSIDMCETSILISLICLVGMERGVMYLLYNSSGILGYVVLPSQLLWLPYSTRTPSTRPAFNQIAPTSLIFHCSACPRNFWGRLYIYFLDRKSFRERHITPKCLPTSPDACSRQKHLRFSSHAHGP
jgi:hypothetical protein